MKMFLAIQPPATTAHAANAQAQQWKDEAAQWAIQTERWHALWGWEIGTALVVILLLAVLVWQNTELKRQVQRLINRTS